MNVTRLSPRHFPTSAEDWLARLLSPDCSASDHAAFEDWLAQSPENALAYAEVERAHQLAGLLASDPLVGTARHRPAARPPLAPRRRRWRPALAWAAALVLALAGGLWLLPGSQQAQYLQYATGIGEQRRVTLPDGSGLVLDTGTAVQVVYGDSQRHVELLDGRLQADVAHDASRPFVVTSRNGSTRALGTVFQVEQQDGRTRVTLLEGRVVVKTPGDWSGRGLELRPLQQVSYDAEGTPSVASDIDPAAAEGWTQGRLIFKDERLASLVAEFNRYSQDKLVLSQPELEDIRVSGAFDANDQAGLLAALRRGWDLEAHPAGRNRIELSAPAR